MSYRFTAIIMMMVPLLGCKNAASTVSPGPPVLTDVEVAAGREAFRGCTTCHCVPESAIPGDADWIRLNRKTTCIDAGEETSRVRAQIEAYCHSAIALRPVLVDRDFRPQQGMRMGIVEFPAVAGSAFLRAERASILHGTPPRVRFSWKPREKIRVPAGKYRLISYLLFIDRDGRWMLTGTDVSGCLDFEVEVGGEFKLDLPAAINGTFSSKPMQGGGLMLRYALRDKHDNVVTLSRDGDFRLPQCSLFDDANREVYRFSFENNCGALSHAWMAADPLFSRAVVRFDTGPFAWTDCEPKGPAGGQERADNESSGNTFQSTKSRVVTLLEQAKVEGRPILVLVRRDTANSKSLNEASERISKALAGQALHLSVGAAEAAEQHLLQAYEEANADDSVLLALSPKGQVLEAFRKGPEVAKIRAIFASSRLARLAEILEAKGSALVICGRGESKEHARALETARRVFTSVRNAPEVLSVDVLDSNETAMLAKLGIDRKMKGVVAVAFSSGTSGKRIAGTLNKSALLAAFKNCSDCGPGG